MDALLALVPLVFLPLVSLISVFFVDPPDFWNYTFPIFSICIAGMYDSYSRYKPNQAKNIKLGVRVFIDFLVIATSAVLQQGGKKERLIPVVILLVCGLFFIFEIFMRVRTQIESSPWYRRGVEKKYVFKK